MPTLLICARLIDALVIPVIVVASRLPRDCPKFPLKYVEKRLEESFPAFVFAAGADETERPAAHLVCWPA